MIDHKRLSKMTAHALRHAPWLYELEIDEEGWVPLSQLLDAFRNEQEDWRDLKSEDFQEMIAMSPKKRYEIREGRIRAFYGHSLPGKILKENQMPPEILFHGTSRNAASLILEKGLLPMGRQYVHLSADRNTAVLVGKRKDRSPVILSVRSGDAFREGIRFFRGNEDIWLADKIPKDHITVV